MDSKNGNVIHKKTVLNNIIKVLLSSDYPNHILIILVTRGTLFIYPTAAQIVTIHHIRYQHNHQQILTYKRVGYCLLTLFTFSTILNITMIKLNNLILFFFFFILSDLFYSAYLILFNWPGHETIKREIFRSTNSDPLQMMQWSRNE